MWPYKAIAPALILAPVVLGAVTAPRAAAQCQVAKLTASDGAREDRFGYSVGVSGEVVAVGAPWDDDRGLNTGSVYLFERCGPLWSPGDKLPPVDAPIGAGFGRSLAVDGEILLVAALSEGAAYVFERGQDGAWCQAARLTGHDTVPMDFFGWSAALSGNVAVVGAPEDDDNGSRSGSVYVFERGQDGTWSQVAKLIADDGDSHDFFGGAVAIDGDVIAVGAPDDEELGNWSGSAYVFERDPDSTWSQVSKLLASDGGGFDSFGASVSVSADVVLVGAYDADGNDVFAGAAYVFNPEGPTWGQVAKLTAADGQNGDRFGIAVAIDGELGVIGARGDDDLGYSAGSAYVFVRNEDDVWSQVAKLLADDGAAEDRFGKRVAVSGNVALIAAYTDDDQGEDSGSAYVFAVGPDEDGDGVMDACECRGDLNHDWIVDYYDLALLLADWDCNDPHNGCPGDCDADGDTDHADLGILLGNWGEVCP